MLVPHVQVPQTPFAWTRFPITTRATSDRNIVRPLTFDQPMTSNISSSHDAASARHGPVASCACSDQPPDEDQAVRRRRWTSGPASENSGSCSSLSFSTSSVETLGHRTLGRLPGSVRCRLAWADASTSRHSSYSSRSPSLARPSGGAAGNDSSGTIDSRSGRRQRLAARTLPVQREIPRPRVARVPAGRTTRPGGAEAASSKLDLDSSGSATRSRLPAMVEASARRPSFHTRQVGGITRARTGRGMQRRTAWRRPCR